MSNQKISNLELSLTKLVSTGIFSGLVPKAPGTVGSLLYLALHSTIFFLFKDYLLLSVELLIALLVTSIAFYSTASALRLKLFQNDKDPKEIVIDEWAGMSIALIGAPLNAYGLISSFILFRIFDISKIGPVKRLEALPGAKGIVLDDVMAGILALILRLALDMVYLKLVLS